MAVVSWPGRSYRLNQSRSTNLLSGLSQRHCYCRGHDAVSSGGGRPPAWLGVVADVGEKQQLEWRPPARLTAEIGQLQLRVGTSREWRPVERRDGGIVGVVNRTAAGRSYRLRKSRSTDLLGGCGELVTVAAAVPGVTMECPQMPPTITTVEWCCSLPRASLPDGKRK
nr:hypothetical protein Iba_chr05dCG19080 [Ipomoea batatas]